MCSTAKIVIFNYVGNNRWEEIKFSMLTIGYPLSSLDLTAMLLIIQLKVIL